jgi:alpha-glucosidase
LTLLVCVDRDGRAEGFLYEDEGDGFGYQKGQYRLTELKAVKEKKQLKVTLRKKEGMMPETDRKIRIGYVYGGRVQYSTWKTGDEITISI